MKKISIFLIAMLFIVSAIPFSASADEALPITNLTNTKWTIPATNAIDSSVRGQYIFSGTINGNREFTKLYIGGYYSNGNLAQTQNAWSYYDGSWNTFNSNGNPFPIEFSDVGTDLTNSTLIAWLNSKATLDNSSVCDGTSCSISDDNNDGICDTCGMATYGLIRNYVPEGFPSGYPTVPISDERYYLCRLKSADITYLVIYPDSVTPSYDSTISNGTLNFSSSFGVYRLIDDTWTLFNEDDTYSLTGMINVESIYSSVQINDENGTHFFPVPLWETVNRVTQGGMTQVTALGGTMKILTVCGISCLALVVLLPILLRVLRIYLAR